VPFLKLARAGEKRSDVAEAAYPFADLQTPATTLGHAQEDKLGYGGALVWSRPSPRDDSRIQRAAPLPKNMSQHCPSLPLSQHWG
jgi:hypothetical protein